MNPVTELRAFVRAALVDPVPRDHTEPDSAFHRRRVVAAVTLLVGAVVLAWALRIEPGDPTFYVATFALAGVWAGGAFLSGPLHLGHAHTRDGGESSRAVVQSLALGALLLGLFMVGAVVVAQIPFLRDPVQELLDHARFGSLALVTVITIVNGIAEELYFRGALYAAVGRRHAVAITTVVYTLVTATSGIPLLIFAAALVGLVVAFQRRVTGGILGPADHPPDLVAGHAVPAAPGARPALVRAAPMTSVLWLRRDLRRRDHPALLAARDAAGDGDLVVAFVVDPRLWDGGGAARRAWLAATLEATNDAFDGALTLLHGDPRRVVPDARRPGGGVVGARVARDHPGRPAPRRGGRSAAGGERRRVGRDRHAVCRRAGPGRQRLG